MTELREYLDDRKAERPDTGSSAGSGWMANIIAQLVPFALFLAVTPFAIDQFGPVQFGVITLFSILPTVIVLLDLGLGVASTMMLARRCARGDGASALRLYNGIHGVALLLGVGIAIAFWVFRTAIFDVLNITSGVHDVDAMTLALMAWILAAFLNMTGQAGLRARARFRRLAILQSIANGGIWLAVFVIGLTSQNVIAIVWMSAGAALFSALLGNIWARSDFRSLATTIADRPEAEEEWPLRFALGIFILQIMTTLVYQSDRLLVSALLSPALAGGYAVCSGVASKLYMMTSAIAAYTLPRAAHLHTLDETAALRDLFRNGGRTTLLVTIMISVPLMMVAHPLLAGWLGADFADAYTGTFRILVFAYMLASVGLVPSNVATGMLLSRIGATLATCGGVLMILSCLLLVPRIGVEGAAIGVCIGTAQSVIMAMVIGRRLIRDGDAQAVVFLLQLVSAALPIAVGLALLSPFLGSLFLAVPALALGALAILGLWFGLGFARHAEVEFLQSAIPARLLKFF